jgi:hypothetical protein
MHLTYSRAALRRDLVRSGAGLAACGGVLAVEPLPALFWTALAAGALFAAFGARALARRSMVVAVDEQGIVVRRPLGPVGRLAWNRVERVALSYFPGRRDGDRGWFELALFGDGRRLKVDQGLDGFEALVDMAERAARARGLPLSAATEANLAVRAARAAA